MGLDCDAMVIGGVGSSDTILFSTSSSSSSWGKSSKISTGFSKIALLGARCRFCLLTMRSDFFSLGVVLELSAKSCNDMSLMPSVKSDMQYLVGFSYP